MYKIIPELHDAEWLRKRYAEVSAYRIAKELSCTKGSVHVALHRHGIKMRPSTHDQVPKELKDQSWLLSQYGKLSTPRIAEMLGCSPTAVNHALRRFGVELREPGRERGPAQLQDREWLEEQYRDYTTHEIAKLIGCSQITVLKAMRRLDISLNGRGKRLRISKYKQQIGPDGKIRPQHRLIMEAHLGRKLESAEHVHHIDGNGLNNALENLIVLMESQHHRLHGHGAKERMARFDYLHYEHTCAKCGAHFTGGNRAKRCASCRHI